MMDRMYCLTCKQLFSDTRETRRRQKTITYGQFMFNQQRVMWDEPVQFKGNKRVFIISCPFCKSMHTVNATEIKERTDSVRTSGRNQYNRHLKKIDDRVLRALKQAKV